jgi:phosphoribosylformylglycinamidine synthase subunit PurSL
VSQTGASGALPVGGSVKPGRSMPNQQTDNATYWSIRVRPRTARLDGHGRDTLSAIRQVGLAHIEAVRSSKVYLFAGRLSRSDIDLLATELLTDPVAEVSSSGVGLADRDPVDGTAVIEVQTRPGVMNPVALSTLAAARRLLRARGSTDARLHDVQTARRYEVIGAQSADELEAIARNVLANDCIEMFHIDGLGRHDRWPQEWPVPPERPFEIRHIKLRGLDDNALMRLSREGHLFLSLEEMRTIQSHFDRLGRDPTDLELETLAQTWSEHCVHKTLKSEIEYEGEDFGRPGHVRVRFDNLLKDTIARATHELNRPWCLSVFVDNAGIIAFDDEHGVAFKVETHNHPSAIEPYGGAATGVGGCIRDIMGCGLGAKPIASTDVFCLAPPDFDAARLPKDVLHPARVLKGVVAGVRDYGNRMGIPTVNGAIYFDERYLANPLVFCGCVGLIPRDRIEKEPRTGDFIVVAGGRTGRDGIHGATFSSAELTDSHADEFAHAVQIGNAIEEKKLLDAQLIARDHPDGCLYSSVTDCGAGGLSSAVGEMGEILGATVDLEKVPLKYAGLRYDEVWISEAQERMVFAVPPNRLDTFLRVFEAEEVEATVIGRFTDDRVLRVRYRGETVGELDMAFVHEGLPKSIRRASWTAPSSGSIAQAEACGSAGASPSHAAEAQPAVAAPSCRSTSNANLSLSEKLLAALGDWNVASKEWVIRQYDHEVQGRSTIKPLVGPGFGPSDAAVLRPIHAGQRGIAIGCGLCPHLSEVDPYVMAVAAVDEALRNVICVGADPNRTAILDNFCWPKADTEVSMGALVRTCCGARDAALAYGLPFISGKDSLNNEFSMSESEARRTGLPLRIAIPPTLLISALGIVEDIARCVTMDLKQPGHALVLASAPVDRGGLQERGAETLLAEAKALHHKVAALIAEGKVASAHDVSDGGLAVAIAEMCIAGSLGAQVELDAATWSDSLFEPIATTYLLEMSESNARTTNWPIIGRVDESPVLKINMAGESATIPVKDMAAAWREPLARGTGAVS